MNLRKRIANFHQSKVDFDNHMRKEGVFRAYASAPLCKIEGGGLMLIANAITPEMAYEFGQWLVKEFAPEKGEEHE
jgi:hypothetical protein